MNGIITTNKQEQITISKLCQYHSNNNKWMIRADVVSVKKFQKKDGSGDFLQFYLMDFTGIIKAMYFNDDRAEVADVQDYIKPGCTHTFALATVKNRSVSTTTSSSKREGEVNRPHAFSLNVDGNDYPLSNVEMTLNPDSCYIFEKVNETGSDSIARKIIDNEEMKAKFDAFVSGIILTEDKNEFTPIQNIPLLPKFKCINVKVRILDMIYREGMSKNTDRPRAYKMTIFKLGDSSGHCIDMSKFLGDNSEPMQLGIGDVITIHDTIIDEYMFNHKLKFDEKNTKISLLTPRNGIEEEAGAGAGAAGEQDNDTDSFAKDGNDASWIDVSNQNNAQLYPSIVEVGRRLERGEDIKRFKLNGVYDEIITSLGIWYQSCGKTTPNNKGTSQICQKKATPRCDGFFCDNHGVQPNSIYRYLIRADIQDQKDNTFRVVCFNEVGKMMMGGFDAEEFHVDKYSDPAAIDQEVQDRFKVAKSKEDGSPRVHCFTMSVKKDDSSGRTSFNYALEEALDLNPEFDGRKQQQQSKVRYIPYRGESVFKRQKILHGEEVASTVGGGGASINMATAN